MMRNLYCPLCGVCMQVSCGNCNQASHNPGTGAPHPWYQEVRAVYSSSLGPEIGGPYLTGVGLVDHGWSIVTPTDSAARYSDENILTDRHRLFYPSKTSSFAVFFLHDACWRLFSLRVSGSEGVHSAVVTCLFKLLFSASWDDKTGYFSFCQDLGGALEYQASYGDRIDNFIHSNPYQSLDFRQLQNEINDSWIVEAANKCCTSEFKDYADYFSRLPDELIQEIFTNLSIQDLMCARLASRAIAHASTIYVLGQSFWKSRFSVDFEMGFASSLTIQTAHPFDWRSRYFIIKAALSRPNDYYSLRNRKRIWRAITQISRIARLLLQSGGLRGNSAANTEQTSINPSQDAQNCPHLGQMISGNMNADYEQRHLNRSIRFCRELEVKTMTIPALPRELSIGISILAFDDRRYISGLRVINDDYDSLPSCSALGLLTLEDESVFRLSTLDDLHGVEVACISTGIIALRFVTGDRVDQISNWFGELPESLTAVEFCRLVACEGQRICGFRAGIDACKFVSFGVLECPSAMTSPHKQTKVPRFAFYDNKVWKSCIPYHLIDPGNMIPRPQKVPDKLPLVNIDFGGADGQLLCCLVRISIIFRLDWGCIMGMEFHYNNNQPSRLYGRTGGVEKTFPIDGPGGERIIRIDVGDDVGFFKNKRSHLFDLYTNFHGHCSYLIQASQRSLRKGKHTNLVENPESLEAQTDQVIIGFIATEMADPLGLFENLSIAIRKCDINSSQTTIGEVERPRKWLQEKDVDDAIRSIDIGSNILFFSGRLSAVAPLHGIRRLRFSRGCEGRSRSPSDISGIWVDYWHCSRPRILGQWFQESHTLEIEQGSWITEFSVWMNSSPRFRQAPKQGQVMGIEISTSSGQTGFVGDRISQYPVQITYQCSRLQQLLYLSWSSDRVFDHLRAITTADTRSHSIRMQPPIEQTWFVPQIIPWEDQTSTGSIDRLQSITIHREADIVLSLCFKYTSGKIRHIGPPRQGEQCNSTVVSFDNDEVLTRFETGWSRKGLHKVSFLITRGHPNASGRSAQLKSSTAQLSDEIELHDLGDATSSEHSIPPNDADALKLGSDNGKLILSSPHLSLFPCPHGMKFAGFWVRVSRRRIHNLGVVYEPSHVKLEKKKKEKEDVD